MQHTGFAICRETTRAATDSAEQTLGCFHDAIGYKVADVLHLGQDIDIHIFHVGMPGHGRDGGIGQTLHDLVNGARQ